MSWKRFNDTGSGNATEHDEAELPNVEVEIDSHGRSGRECWVEIAPGRFSARQGRQKGYITNIDGQWRFVPAVVEP